MASFAKFDPRAFLESEKRTATNKPRTLAALATLAAHGPQVEDRDAGSDYCKFGKYRKFEPTPAKAANVSLSDTAIQLTSWGEAQEERAAIVEHDGGVPREWAEALARLDPAGPPGDVPSKRWVRFIDDCGRFVDDGWASCAEALGWGPLELFGCDRRKPYARIDHAGLLWLLNGQRLLALSANAAAVSTTSGSRLTYYRRPSPPDQVLVWELAP